MELTMEATENELDQLREDIGSELRSAIPKPRREWMLREFNGLRRGAERALRFSPEGYNRAVPILADWCSDLLKALEFTEERHFEKHVNYETVVKFVHDLFLLAFSELEVPQEILQEADEQGWMATIAPQRCELRVGGRKVFECSPNWKAIWERYCEQFPNAQNGRKSLAAFKRLYQRAVKRVGVKASTSPWERVDMDPIRRHLLLGRPDLQEYSEDIKLSRELLDLCGGGPVVGQRDPKTGCWHYRGVRVRDGLLLTMTKPPATVESAQVSRATPPSTPEPAGCTGGQTPDSTD